LVVGHAVPVSRAIRRACSAQSASSTALQEAAPAKAAGYPVVKGTLNTVGRLENPVLFSSPSLTA
jgi:hypothetical protein